MIHAVIVENYQAVAGKVFEIPVGDTVIYLAKAEYTQEELAQFRQIAPTWILQCKGSRYFYAANENGEDAEARYIGYFDLDESLAIFDKGRFVGFYFLPRHMDYSGNYRGSYTIHSWGFPGYTLDDNSFSAKQAHVFLFDKAATHSCVYDDDWTLLHRHPGELYENDLDF